MSEKQALPRPRQVTFAGGFAVVASLLLVVSLFDTLGQVRSADMAETIDDFLAKPPGSGLGLSTTQVVEVLRVLVFVSAGLGAAALVLAIYVLQRHNGARIGFTVVAGLLLFTAPVAGLMPILLAVTAAMLWSGPARDWYAGRPPRAVLAEADRPGLGPGVGPVPPGQASSPQPAPVGDPQAAQGAQAPPVSTGPAGPVAAPGAGGPPAGGPQGWGPPAAGGWAPVPPPHPGWPATGPWQAQPGAWPPPQGWGAYGAGGPVPAARPLTVTIAVIITWVSTALIGLAFAAVGAVLALARDDLVTELEKDPQFADLGIDRDQLVTSLWVGVAVVLVWCLASFVLAVFAFRRAQWARILLVVSAVVSALFSLAAAALAIVYLLLVIPVVVLLFTGGANAWYSGTPRGGPGGWGGQAGQGDPAARRQPKAW